jgi:hypothetical protein
MKQRKRKSQKRKLKKDICKYIAKEKNPADKRTPITYDPNFRFTNLVVAKKVNLYFMKQHHKDRLNLPLE